jgi:transposase-like protein
MPGPYPREFREDVVAVARRRESGVTIEQIAADFDVSEATLQNGLRQADVEDGNRPGETAADAAEARELKKRIRLREQENERRYRESRRGLFADSGSLGISILG